MDKIKEYIKEKRPSLGTSSILTYASILKNLYHRVFGKDDVNFKKFNETEPILHFLKDMACNKRKTILSALVVITDNNDFKKLMAEDVQHYNMDIKKQEKSPEQKENWVSSNDIEEIYNDLKKNAELLYKKKTLSSSDFQQIQNYIIISILSGIFIPPRRLKDYTEFIIKDIDKNKDNYMDKNKLYFNTYKTSSTYGEQVVEIPKTLQTILNKWIKINPTKYLLFDTNNNKLSSVKLNQRINKIFDGKHVSVNNFRHTYLTDKYKNYSFQEKKLDDDMTAMGSSKGMASTYIKLD